MAEIGPCQGALTVRLLQGVGQLDEIDGRPVDAIVARGRFHHQYLPDRSDVEPDALDDETMAVLEVRGHDLRRRDDSYGNMQVVSWDRSTGEVSAASDPRVIGAAEVRRVSD